MKNSNVKKIAALSMALFMAASVLPTNVKAAEYELTGVCSSSTYDVSCGMTLFSKIDQMLEDIDFSDIGLADGGFKVGDTTYTFYQAIDKYSTALESYAMITKDEDVKEKVENYIDTVNGIKTLFEGVINGKTSDGSTSYEYTAEEVAEIPGLVKTVNDAFKDNGKYNTDRPTSSVLRDAKRDFSKMNELSELGVAERLGTVFEDAFYEAYDKMDDFVSEYIDEDEMFYDFVDAFERILEADLDEESINISEDEAYITGYPKGKLNPIDTSSKTEIKARINKIKKAPDYNQFKNETEVEEIIEEYEEMLDAIEEFSDLTRSDAYKDYIKDETSSEDMTVKDFIFKELEIKSTLDDYSRTTVEKETEKLMYELDMEQYNVLKALMKDVVNEAWNYETKEGKDRYTDKSDWVKGVSTSQKNALTKNIPALLFVMVDSETGKSGWEMIEEHMTEFEKAWKAVTTDIEKLSVVGLKASDGEKIYAADSALFDLTDDGMFEKNLTSKQRKEIKRIESNIKSLKTAYILAGLKPEEQKKEGWVNVGNGNWNYIKDGKMYTGWVASGNDWYFIKNGQMLRNAWIAKDSTGDIWYYVGNDGAMLSNTYVGGYWLNSYGQWSK